ncbi:MAG: hypothetical protein ABJ314_19430, partial [Ilumatobacter sp.]
MIVWQPGAVVVLRSATVDDSAFLREMLAVAADWRPEAAARSGDEIVRDPAVAHYVVGWPRGGD